MKRINLVKLLFAISFIAACTPVTQNPSTSVPSTSNQTTNNPTSASSSSITTPEVVNYSSWEDFKFWDEYPDEYWSINDKYQGSRTDFRSESIYFTTTSRFYDGDTGNNIDCLEGVNTSLDPAWRGDFKGLIQKMDYIKALGFTTIWITPVIENASGYDFDGYYPFDMTKVDSRYNSEDVDFQKVIEEAHKRDMKICLDIVLNHTGSYGETNLLPLFYKDENNTLKISTNSSLPENYFSLDSNEQYETRVDALTNNINNIYHQNSEMVWKSFNEQVSNITDEFIDLNTENPLVAEYLVKSYGNFIKMGVDFFNIENMKHISRLTINKYMAPALYEFARKCGNGNFFIFGEVSSKGRDVWYNNTPALSVPFYTWKEAKDYDWGDTQTNLASIEQAYNDNSTVDGVSVSSNALLDGINYHTPDYSNSNGVGVVDYVMHQNFDDAGNAFRATITSDQYYNDSTYNVVYVDSHDSGPDGMSSTRFNLGSQAWAENLNLMFTFRGVPCIYYGSEIEFQKGLPLDANATLPLSETAKAYFGDYLEGDVTASKFGVFTASGRVNETLNYSLARHIIKLNLVRQAIPALSLGQYTTDATYVSFNNIAFAKRYTKDGIDSLALVSISGGATFKNLPNGKYIDAITGDIKNVSNGTLTVSDIGRGNMRVYVCCASGFKGIDGPVGPTGQTYLK